MAGVTRMNVTLAVIMFELTGSLNHVLPFSFAILVANWVANAFEPNSVYEQILKTNNLPYLDNRRTIPTDATLADIVTPSQSADVIDLMASNTMTSTRLRTMLVAFQRRSEFDGSIPLVNGNRLVGVIFIPELEFALDQIEQAAAEAGVDQPLLCYFKLDDGPTTPSEQASESGYLRHHSRTMSLRSDATVDVEITPQAHGIDTDLGGIVVRAPLTMDLATPLPLVNMAFTKMGTRIVCAVDNGNFIGILHRKGFTDFCRTQR
jgi:chloride channel 3/4/5